jgi:AcrR family transcriptional regulator
VLLSVVVSASSGETLCIINASIVGMTSRDAGAVRDAKERILDAAVTRLHREKLTVGLDGISLETAIADSGVARATGYRRWPNREDFARAVLVRVVREAELPPEDADTLEAIRSVIAQVTAAAGRGEIIDPRRTAVVEALRIATEADFSRLSSSRQWHDYLVLRVTSDGLKDNSLRAELRHELQNADRAFAEHRGKVYERVTRTLGYRVQVPGLGEDASLKLMSSTLGALMSGLIISGNRDDDVEDAPSSSFRTAAFGSEFEGEWSAASYALTSAFLTFLVPPVLPADSTLSEEDGVSGLDLQDVLNNL